MFGDSYTKYKIIKPLLEQGISPKAISESHNVSLRTLQRWCKSYKNQGLVGLENQQRSDKGKYRSISDKLLHLIEGLALNRARTSIATIYDQTNKLAKILNEPNASYSTIIRIINNLPKSMRVLAQEGDKAYEEAFELLYMREANYPNEIWQADHTLLDIYLIDNRGRPTRPWLTIIITPTVFKDSILVTDLMRVYQYGFGN